MTEITQADWDAADEHFNLWYPNTAWGYEPLADAFARHREQAEQETVAKIVAWLRDQNQLRIAPMDIANAIEAGEWK